MTNPTVDFTVMMLENGFGEENFHIIKDITNSYAYLDILYNGAGDHNVNLEHRTMLALKYIMPMVKVAYEQGKAGEKLTVDVRNKYSQIGVG